jgi:hypothetical protein
MAWNFDQSNHTDQFLIRQSSGRPFPVLFNDAQFRLLIATVAENANQNLKP